MISKRAGEIMIPLDRYPHIPYWFTLRQAVAELEKAELEIEGRKSLARALLVFDEKYQLLGIVRRRDILRGLEPKFLRTMGMPSRKKLFDVETDPDLVDFTTGRLARALQEQADHAVSEVMLEIKTTVDANDHLAKIIYKMFSMDVNLVPVLEKGNVVGVVRSVDVFRQIAKIIL